MSTSTFSIAGLIQEVVETSKDWKKIFADNFGKAGNAAIQAADEAYYKLLEAGKHSFIVSVWETAWSFVLRANILRSFMTGKAVEKDKDGVRTEHQYPAAPREQSEKVAAAVAPLLMQRIMSLPVASRPVGKEYWFVDREVGKRFDTAPVGMAIASMHALINITDDLGDAAGRRAIARAWYNKFGTLPGPVFYRVKDIFEHHEPAPVAAMPAETENVPDNDMLRRKLAALSQKTEPVAPEDVATFTAAVDGLANISPESISAAAGDGGTSPTTEKNEPKWMKKSERNARRNRVGLDKATPAVILHQAAQEAVEEETEARIAEYLGDVPSNGVPGVPTNGSEPSSAVQ